jgi:hypothetical protein
MLETLHPRPILDQIRAAPQAHLCWALTQDGELVPLAAGGMVDLALRELGAQLVQVELELPPAP